MIVEKTPITPIIGIYKITSPSGRIYVGQSYDIYKRWNDYKYGRCKNQVSLYESFNKYGVKNHPFEIIEVIQQKATQLEIDEREIFFIKKFNSNNKEYGMNLKGGGSYGKHSDSTKAKLSLAHKGLRTGYKHSEESKKRMSISQKGKVVSEESRRNISKSKLGIPNPNVAGEKNGMFGRGHTEEAKLKMSLSRKGKVAPNRVYAIGENHPRYGITLSEEIINKIRIKNSGENHPRYGKFGKENPLSKKVIQLSLYGEPIRTWDGMSDVQRELGIPRSSIAKVCKGKASQTGGFKWEYINPEPI